ncbi:MAG: hypothetical protein ABFS34_00490 [Gemmatimonadota bacterium]
MTLSRARIPALAFAAAVASAVGGSLFAQSARWRPEDRVLVSDFSEVGALATDDRLIYVGSSAGIGVFDVSFDRWLDPITAEDGYPVAADPTALAFDIVSNELWLATVDGRLFSYSPFFGRWRDEGLAASPPVFDIVFSDEPGRPVFLRESSGWSVLERGSFTAQSLPRGVSPPLLGSAAADPMSDPLIRARGRTLTIDEVGRSWPVTDAVSLLGSPDVWIGTYGGHLFRYSDFASEPAHYVYGVPSRGVSTLLVSDDAIWFGGDAGSRRQGVARADHDLDRWLQWEGRVHGAPRGRVRELAEVEGRLWAGAEDGLYVLEADGRWSRAGARLPDDRVLAVLPAPGGAWVGTRRGAVFVDADGETTSGGIAPGVRVAGLAAYRGDLWLATDAGVLRAVGAARTGASTTLVRLGDSDPRWGAVARSVVATETAVYAAFDRAVRRVDRAGEPDPPLGPGGREARLRVADGRVWLAGVDGARAWDPDTGELIEFEVGPDIPAGPVRDVGVGAGGVWLATPLGALLLRRGW